MYKISNKISKFKNQILICFLNLFHIITGNTIVHSSTFKVKT